VKVYLVQENSTGKLFLLSAKDTESAYKLFGKVIDGMEEPIDTGNVDINLFEVKPVPKGQVQSIEFQP